MSIRRNTTALFVPAALAAFACSSAATAQATFEFTNSGQTLGNSASWSVALGDLDGDGDLDAMVANRFSNPNTVWTNDGNGTFTNSGQTLGNVSSFSVALGDLDGDGDLDAMVANWDSANPVWTNDGSGTFTNSGQSLGYNNSISVALGDLDGDGDLDAMFANTDGEGNTVWTNDGSGTFADSGQSLGNRFSFSVALGDLDGDGDLDAMVANGDLDAIVGNFYGNTVWTNNGNGTFTDSGQSLGYNYSISVALGDLDGDGDLDAMVGNYGEIYYPGDPNTVWTNDGSGTFANSGQSLGNSNSISVALGDLDGDGDLDAMVANTSGQHNTVWTNDAAQSTDVYNQDAGVWYYSAREAIAAAEANDHLLIWGGAFNISGVIDTRELPLTFIARAPVVFGEDLLFLASDGSSFLDLNGNGSGFDIAGRFIAPENGSLVLSSLDLTAGGEMIQNNAFLIGYLDISNSAGACYLKGEVSAGMTSTGPDGVNYVADDTNVYGDYTNDGATIIQRGILYVFGDLVNNGTLTGEYNNGFDGGDAPDPGDGYSIGGSYIIGQDATLSMPNPVWWLRVGGDLDVAINDPANFTMSQATIELNGLAPGNSQTLEALSADLGAVEAGFDSSNFPIGALRITSNSITQLVNNHVNSVDAACEVLYVDELFVSAGGTLLTNGCPIYVRSATIDGTVDDPEAIVIVQGAAECRADLTGDGEVNGADLAFVLGSWGTNDSPADFNGDGDVDGADLAVVLGAWGACP
jgi:hypothetical protein